MMATDHVMAPSLSRSVPEIQLLIDCSRTPNPENARRGLQPRETSRMLLTKATSDVANERRPPCPENLRFWSRNANSDSRPIALMAAGAIPCVRGNHDRWAGACRQRKEPTLAKCLSV